MKAFHSIKHKITVNNILSSNINGAHFLHFKDENNFVLGWDIAQSFRIKEDKGTLADVQSFIDENNGEYIFSAFSYEIKNQIYPYLSSKNKDDIDFPLCELHICKNVLLIIDNQALYYGNDTSFSGDIFLTKKENKGSNKLNFSLAKLKDKETYKKEFEEIKENIQFGNIYEINHCICQKGTFTGDDYLNLGKNLLNAMNAPFSAIWNTDTHFISCNSPERFLKKVGLKLTSQPIKGTKQRESDPELDEKSKASLPLDPKERAENIMIVDLVRNDLSKIATKNSVKVGELCGTYSFKTVHQMISTISCEIKKETNFTAILSALFPMGSMTGAPKISAMKIAEEQETFKRGIYSGSIGIIEPNGNFDFNVIIRSFIASKENKTFKVPVGGAITTKANAANEYAECLLKLAAIKQQLV